MNKVNWPSDWASIPLNDVVIRHNSGIYKNRDTYGEGTNIVGVGDLYQVTSIDGQVFRRVPLTASEKHRYLLNEGDLIYGESSLVLDGIARTLCVTVAGAGTAFAWHTRRFSSNRNAVESKFLYYLLSGDDARRQLMANATQTALTGITTTGFFRTELHLPPLPEQRKIARILTTVDNLIEKTEALIEKYKAIKQGMMHDLFTRGVDSKGKLRPPYEEVPHLYKESPLGWIPKEWEASILDEAIRIIDCKHFTPLFVKDGYAFIRPRNVQLDGLNLADLDYVSLKDFRLLTDKHEPKRGDIIFSRNASFGVPCFVETNQQLAIGQDTVVMTKSKADTKYIYYILLSQPVETQVMQVSTGSTFGRINLAFIRELRIPIPFQNEQQEIATRLDTLNLTIKREQFQNAKFKKIKTGLMQDLLTGKVRVRVDQEKGITENE